MLLQFKITIETLENTILVIPNHISTKVRIQHLFITAWKRGLDFSVAFSTVRDPSSSLSNGVFLFVEMLLHVYSCLWINSKHVENNGKKKKKKEKASISIVFSRFLCNSIRAVKSSLFWPVHEKHASKKRKKKRRTFIFRPCWRAQGNNMSLEGKKRIGKNKKGKKSEKLLPAIWNRCNCSFTSHGKTAAMSASKLSSTGEICVNSNY